MKVTDIPVAKPAYFQSIRFTSVRIARQRWLVATGDEVQLLHAKLLPQSETDIIGAVKRMDEEKKFLGDQIHSVPLYFFSINFAIHLNKELIFITHSRIRW